MGGGGGMGGRGSGALAVAVLQCVHYSALLHSAFLCSVRGYARGHTSIYIVSLYLSPLISSLCQRETDDAHMYMI